MKYSPSGITKEKSKLKQFFFGGVASFVIAGGLFGSASAVTNVLVTRDNVKGWYSDPSSQQLTNSIIGVCVCVCVCVWVYSSR